MNEMNNLLESYISCRKCFLFVLFVLVTIVGFKLDVIAVVFFSNELGLLILYALLVVSALLSLWSALDNKGRIFAMAGFGLFQAMIQSKLILSLQFINRQSLANGIENLFFEILSIILLFLLLLWLIQSVKKAIGISAAYMIGSLPIVIQGHYLVVHMSHEVLISSIWGKGVIGLG